MINPMQMPAETRAGLFFLMVHVGAAATVLLIATLVFDLPDFVDGFPQGVLLVAIGVILHRKLRDEYVEQLWQAGTAAAFVAVTAACLLGPVVAGLSGELTGHEWQPMSWSMPLQWPAAIALAGFFAGFYGRMLAGMAAE